jgi:hypothetical protein
MSDKKKDLIVIIVFLIAVLAGAAHLIAIKQIKLLFGYLLGMVLFIVASYFHVSLVKRSMWVRFKRRKGDLFDEDIQPRKSYLICEKIEAWSMLFAGLVLLYVATKMAELG